MALKGGHRGDVRHAHACKNSTTSLEERWPKYERASHVVFPLVPAISSSRRQPAEGRRLLRIAGPPVGLVYQKTLDVLLGADIAQVSRV